MLHVTKVRTCGIALLYPGSSPCQKAGREPGRSDHMPRDVLCVVLCVVLVIESLPTLSALSVISGTPAFPNFQTCTFKERFASSSNLCIKVPESHSDTMSNISNDKHHSIDLRRSGMTHKNVVNTRQQYCLLFAQYCLL